MDDDERWFEERWIQLQRRQVWASFLSPILAVVTAAVVLWFTIRADVQDRAAAERVRANYA